MPPLHTPTPPTPQDASILGLNKTFGIAGTVIKRLFQHVVHQEARYGRGGGQLKDGEKRHKFLEECGSFSSDVVFLLGIFGLTKNWNILPCSDSIIIGRPRIIPRSITEISVESSSSM